MIENGPIVALASPSETEILMPLYTPTSASVGVPLSLPVDVLKLAQPGFPVIENVSVSLSESSAVGVKLYALFAFTWLGGLPEIVGAEFPGLV